MKDFVVVVVDDDDDDDDDDDVAAAVGWLYSSTPCRYLQPRRYSRTSGFQQLVYDRSQRQGKPLDLYW